MKTRQLPFSVDVCAYMRKRVQSPKINARNARHVFTTLGHDHIRFLFVEWDGDKKPRFFKGPYRFSSLLSIPIKYIFRLNQREGRARSLSLLV
jgi:hypothetical protein